MHLSMVGLFDAKWTEIIHQEWIRNFLKKNQHLEISRLQKIKDLMNAAIPSAHIHESYFSNLIPSLNLPDKNDRHVLAAAIVSKADVIVTFNLKDFPRNILAGYSTRAAVTRQVFL